ncbi:hypothetical protein C9J03_10620 [Photobacterium gaetbulicola]|uniref:Uncharacterized protein n=1 Tax=Photobacterium gaetbulicola Gung47 TaxID=658445 RepID=A0A0C5WQ27_9GAMM|nr:hypothetical protein [Photobacterium gaetbulicola]AJR08467.1 hypothetical protein H744_2c1801 [Photobacterium gaetbulicola Gung47]PSU12029.1 hypothetical protein C9J03_10620 [Photobacterium gaetbulicola]
MNVRSLFLPASTSLMLVLFYGLSVEIGHGSLGFAVLAVSLVGLILVNVASANAEKAKDATKSIPLRKANPVHAIKIAGEQ